MKILKYLQIPAVVIGLVVVLLTVIEIRSCSHEKQTVFYSELEGRYEAYQEKVSEEREEWQKQKESLEKANDILKEDIIEINHDQQSLRKASTEKSEKIKELEAQFSLIKDPAGKIENLKSQIEKWKDKFNLAIDDRNKAEEKAAKWKKQYQNVMIDYALLEKQLKSQEVLNEISREQISALEIKVHRGLLDKIVDIGIKALAVKEGYDILKGVVDE